MAVTIWLIGIESFCRYKVTKVSRSGPSVWSGRGAFAALLSGPKVWQEPATSKNTPRTTNTCYSRRKEEIHRMLCKILHNLWYVYCP